MAFAESTSVRVFPQAVCDSSSLQPQTASERGLPLSESLGSAPSHRFALRRKSFPAERTYMESPKRSLLQKLFPYAIRRRSTVVANPLQKHKTG